MRVAAFQAPLPAHGSAGAIELIRHQVERCESEAIDILCCPEAILGGLADHAPVPRAAALSAETGQLDAMLAPLRSDSVTTIIGFSEITSDGRLYNAAAVLHKGAVLGCYRKQYPAIRRSVYDPGTSTPVFDIPGLRFGILICNDSNYPDLARDLASAGAAVVFIPSNNALPPDRADVVTAARRVDTHLAIANRVWVVRADVTGSSSGLISYGSSAIIDQEGRTVQAGRRLTTDLLVAELESREC